MVCLYLGGSVTEMMFCHKTGGYISGGGLISRRVGGWGGDINYSTWLRANHILRRICYINQTEVYTYI